MKFVAILALLAVGAIVSAQDIKTVDTLDVNKYIGKWYEIARIDTFFQKGCCSEAEYAIIDPKKISVKNYCRKPGKVDTIEGYAFPNPTVSKLGVKFYNLPFITGDYWVIGLDKDYQWAVTTDRNKKSFYILSRTKTLDSKILANILDIGKKHGYNVDNLIFREQNCKGVAL